MSHALKRFVRFLFGVGDTPPVHGAAATEPGARALAELAASPSRQARAIAEALRALDQPLASADAAWIERIELQRDRLGQRQDLLVDGTLGAPGIYDRNVLVARACGASKQPRPALFLYLLARALAPRRVIELGTNVGISSAYLAAALIRGGADGRVLTLDSSPYRQRLARQVHYTVGLSNVSYVQGLFVETLAPSLRELGGVDLAFIDGHHLYQPTLDYFEQILACAAPDAVLVFDDIHWSDEMKAAWDRIRSDERLGLTVDLETIGLGLPLVSWPYVPVRSVIRPGV